MTRDATGPGFTLADRLTHPTPMAPVEVARVGAQVATELEAWHRGGATHLGVDPDHVEVRADDTGRLHARLRPRADTAPTAPSRYRAPEQVTGRPVGPAADVHALGVVLLDGLLGRRDGPPAVPADLGAAWRYLLTGMIAASPADRPTAATVAHTLRQVPGVTDPVAAAPTPATADDAPRSKLLPNGAHVEPTPVEVPRPNRLARLRPPLPGRRRPPEPDVRQQW